MKLTILGSGSPIFNLKRYAPSFIVETDTGALVLFDCGWGCGINLLKAGYDIQQLDHICISHPHADHLGNLMHILESMFVAGHYFKDRERKKPLYLHGYQGFKKDYNILRDIMFPERIEPYEIKLFESEDDMRQFSGITLISKKVPHNDAYFNACGFRIEAGGKVAAYSGDCKFNDVVPLLAHNADIAVFESSTSPKQYKEKGPAPTHISPYEIGIMASRAGAKKIVLMHLYEGVGEEDIKAAVRENYGGEVIISEDLQVIEV